MSNNCGKELNTLPVLDGCPADNEEIMVKNAVGGWGNGLYGLRTWGDMKACIASSVSAGITFVRWKFKIGDPWPSDLPPESEVVAGDTNIVIPLSNIMEFSEAVILNDVEIPPDDTEERSYTVALSSMGMTITMNEPVMDADKFVIKFARGVASPDPPPPAPVSGVIVAPGDTITLPAGFFYREMVIWGTGLVTIGTTPGGNEKLDNADVSPVGGIPYNAFILARAGMTDLLLYVQTVNDIYYEINRF